MRMRIVGVGMLLLLSVPVLTARQRGNDLYQQGLARETAGDIKGAIQIFERIVQDSSSNRALTAKALVQLGRWSDLLGQEQARKYYERVIREFADQKDAAADARARLDALVKVAAPGASPARRLAIDWDDLSNTRAFKNNVTRDGRHWLRYNNEARAFELVEIGAGTIRRLTTDGPAPPLEAIVGGELSTDGRQLAGIVWKGITANLQADVIELRVFDVGGRGPGRVLTTWDPQEVARNWIAVALFGWAPRDDRIWLFVMRRDQSAQIVSVDTTGKLEVLKTLAWRDSTQAPSLSPDGRFVAYHDGPRGESSSDIYILATDGSRESRIEHPAGDSKPIFLPDGSGMVFDSNRRGARDLWHVTVTDGRAVGQPRLVWRNAYPFGTALRFAETGSLFYYFATNDWATYTVPLEVDAVGTVGAATRLPLIANETNTGAAFSPDGRYLAHFRANAARIVVRELATGREREIPFGAQLGSGFASVDWCWNDTLIATGYVEGNVAYRVNVKDLSVERLPVAARQALCAGNGDEIIYADRVALRPGVPPGTLVRRSLASGRETTLYKGLIRSFARSTDGKRLAVIAWDGNAATSRFRLFTMSAEGGDVSADLAPSQAGRTNYVQEVAWLPSGNRLLASVVETGELVNLNQPQTQQPTWLWEVPLTGAAPRKLGLLPLPKVKGFFYGASSFTVRPDGKELAFQSHEGFVEQTWAIDNLFQFIKAGGGW